MKKASNGRSNSDGAGQYGKGAAKIGVIYVRVSSDEQVKGTSLDEQERQTIKDCKDNGIEVMRIFREEGASAKSVERPVLLEALEFCRKNKKQLSWFVVWKVDRLARNTNDHFMISKILADLGIRLRSTTEPIDDSPIGKFIETVLAGSSEFDNAIRTIRCTGGMKARLMSGIWPWKPPVGYICAQNKKSGQAKTEPDKVNEKVAPILARVLKGFAQEVYSQSDMVKELKKANFYELSGRKPTYQFLDQLLANRVPFYAGLLPNPWPSEDGSDRFIQGKHEAIITVDEMHAIHHIRSGGSRMNVSRKRDNPEFPLKKLALCASCLHPLTGGRPRGEGGNYSYYSCYNKECIIRYKSIRKGDIEKDFMTFLLRVSPNSRFLEQFQEVAIAYWQEQENASKKGSKVYLEQIEELEVRRKNIFDMRESGQYSASQFAERMEEVDSKITEIKLVLNRLPAADYDLKEAVGEARAFLENITEKWDKLTPEARGQFQKVVFPAGIPYSKSESFGTPKMCRIYSLSSGKSSEKTLKTKLVDRTGFEPATPSLQMRCSTN